MNIHNWYNCRPQYVQTTIQYMRVLHRIRLQRAEHTKYPSFCCTVLMEMSNQKDLSLFCTALKMSSIQSCASNFQHVLELRHIASRHASDGTTRPSYMEKDRAACCKSFCIVRGVKSKCHCVGGEFSPCLLLHVLFLLYFFFVLHGHRQMKQCQPA